MSSGSVWSFSPSAKLLLFMVPLILVSILVAVVGPGSHGVALLSDYGRTLWSFGSSEHAPDSHSHAVWPAAGDNVAVPSAETAAGHIEILKKVTEVAPYPSLPPETEDGGSGGVFVPATSPTAAEVAPGVESYQTNTTIAHSPVITETIVPEKESTPQSPPPPPPREYTNLEKLEASTDRSRLAIREANNGGSITDSDYVPNGPMYRNAKVFHRSYLEMEKQFKVFVYEEGEPPVFHDGPCGSIYGMEGSFIHMMEVSKFRTRNPEAAHVFFLPFSVAKMVQYVYIRSSHSFDPLKHTVRDYISVVSEKYPYWNRSLGADHFMVACHDWGPETSKGVRELYKNSMRALCNANTSEGFVPSKDISFPEINIRPGGIHKQLGGPSPSHRPILAFFAGGIHGPIRPILLEHWQHKNDPDMRVHQYLPHGVNYIDLMRKSRFCLCPSGYEVASPRVVEALYTGCVPVLISDHYVPPFSDVLNWKSFSIEVPVSEIPNLKTILSSISSRQYIRLQRRGVQVRRHFEVGSPPKRYDVFHMILHSIWLRRLNLRVHDNR